VARAGSNDDPVTTYAHAVAAGQIFTSRFVHLACERHLEDLTNGAARGLRFDPAAARHAVDFFGFLRHSKGEWAGQTFALAPWQAFVVGCLFGWKRCDGLRRFRTAYCAVPRKNGKSTLSAGIGLYSRHSRPGSAAALVPNIRFVTCWMAPMWLSPRIPSARQAGSAPEIRSSSKPRTARMVRGCSRGSGCASPV
jgi:Phage Terminase